MIVKDVNDGDHEGEELFLILDATEETLGGLRVTLEMCAMTYPTPTVFLLRLSMNFS